VERGKLAAAVESMEEKEREGQLQREGGRKEF
jgi:hypothetical protein